MLLALHCNIKEAQEAKCDIFRECSLRSKSLVKEFARRCASSFRRLELKGVALVSHEKFWFIGTSINALDITCDLVDEMLEIVGEFKGDVYMLGAEINVVLEEKAS